MATICVRTRDNTHADPVKDRRGCYKRGDVVALFDSDRHVPGAQETHANGFAWLRFPGVRAARLREFLDAEREDLGRRSRTGRVEPERTRRRAWRIDLDALPLTARAKIPLDQPIVVAAQLIAGDATRDQVLDALIRKTDGRTAKQEGRTLDNGG